MLRAEDLIPGTRYEVLFDDCCVNGSFTDIFVKRGTYGDGIFDGTLIFEGGYIEGYNEIREVK